MPLRSLVQSLLVAGAMLCCSLPALAVDAPPALLIDSADRGLQRELEQLVRQQDLWTAVEHGELSLVLVDITDPRQPRLAELNGHRMMYAASLPKIAILFGAAVALDDGRLQADANLREDMVNMIRYSCNGCATRVLQRVGRAELIELLQSPAYGFYDPHGEGGLWVGKDYAAGVAYERDPLFNLSHGATAFQVARFYYRLETGTLVSPENTEFMLDALGQPGISHKFVAGLETQPDLCLHRKSGTWRDYHADSALVHARGQTYIIVGLAHNTDGGQWLSQLAEPLHQLVSAQHPASRLAKR